MKEKLQKYITGIIPNKGNKLLAINAMPDHLHILIGFHRATAISDLVHDVKISSSNFIKEKKFIREKFRRQEGFGAFSFSRSQIDAVSLYIERQEEHHKRTTFKNEYINMLKDFVVEYETEYLFSWIAEKSWNDLPGTNTSLFYAIIVKTD